MKLKAQTTWRILWAALCVAAMVLVATFAVLEGVSWLLIAAIAIALACILAIVYAWFAARRIDRLMGSGDRHGSGTNQ